MLSDVQICFPVVVYTTKETGNILNRPVICLPKFFKENTITITTYFG